MVPILTILFITIVFIISFTNKKNTQEQNELDSDFWERERRANSTSKKNIDNLNYIIIPDEFFPSESDAIISDIAKQFLTFKDKTMINLNGITNTELKLTYGVYNFEKLAKYDSTFLDFVAIVPEYCKWLIDTCHEKEKAYKILQFAHNANANSKSIDKMLASFSDTANSI